MSEPSERFCNNWLRRLSMIARIGQSDKTGSKRPITYLYTPQIPVYPTVTHRSVYEKRAFIIHGVGSITFLNTCTQGHITGLA